MLTITPIPALQDNYIWLLQHGFHCVVVDPGVAAPVIAQLVSQSLQLDAILITHHHSDHIDGVAALLQRWPKAIVYAPRSGQYAFKHLPVGENDSIHLDHINLDLSVMEVPGHTLDHVAYYGANYLFCGDTLFSCGCGRLFEGTPEQMYHSLQRLAALPIETQVYCTHEYTEHNLQFAMLMDSTNPALDKRMLQVQALRQNNKPTLPTTIGLELETNPFLRCGNPAIQASANTGTYTKESAAKDLDPVAVFTSIRQQRNRF